jgi:hypothetical protein
MKQPNNGVRLAGLQIAGKGLGFTIAGGVGSPHLAGDDSIFISKLIAGSVAEQDGRLSVGDRVISVQGQPCTGLTHEVLGLLWWHRLSVPSSPSDITAFGLDGNLQQAVELLRSPISPIVIVVEHNAFHKAAAELGKSLGLQQAVGPQVGAFTCSTTQAVLRPKQGRASCGERGKRIAGGKGQGSLGMIVGAGRAAHLALMPVNGDDALQLTRTGTLKSFGQLAQPSATPTEQFAFEQLPKAADIRTVTLYKGQKGVHFARCGSGSGSLQSQGGAPGEYRLWL